MSTRRVTGLLGPMALLLLSGCHHHHAAAPAIATAPPVPVPAGPMVVVSVPPPTHRSSEPVADVPITSSIPVVKPVRPARKIPRKTVPPQVAGNAPVVASTQPAAPSVSLGQLTTTTNDPTATRDSAAAALRRERDRVASVPAAVQAAHPAELEQAQRFLKAANDSWNAADYVGTIALTTKARVLLDDLLR